VSLVFPRRSSEAAPQTDKWSRRRSDAGCLMLDAGEDFSIQHPVTSIQDHVKFTLCVRET
jgi:hypothetical protein